MPEFDLSERENHSSPLSVVSAQTNCSSNSTRDEESNSLGSNGQKQLPFCDSDSVENFTERQLSSEVWYTEPEIEPE